MLHISSGSRWKEDSPVGLNVQDAAAVPFEHGLSVIICKLEGSYSLLAPFSLW